LDNEALFYMRSRGIHEDHARTLLMYAFVARILDKIKIAPLKERYADMIKGRLSGNLGICEQCVLDCSMRSQ
jgi:Fe-S cluster assembly protein SufD